MISENIYKDIKTPKVFKMCHICGCKIKHPEQFQKTFKLKKTQRGRLYK